MENRKVERKGNFWGSAAVASAGIFLSWAAFELGMAPLLRPGRDAIDRSLDPQTEEEAEDQAVKLVEEVANEAKVKEMEMEKEGVEGKDDVKVLEQTAEPNGEDDINCR